MKNTLPLRLRFADFELDLKSGELYKSGQRIVLQEQPLQVLRMLVDRAGQITTREEIREQLWPNDTVVEFDHSINAAIKKLRNALGDSAENPRYIETIARRGYRLVVPVERLDSAATDASGSGVVSNSHDGTGAVQVPIEPSGVTGKTISHYRVLEIVGSGGMGVIYKAEDLKLGRAVALKFLPQDVAYDPAALERFEREARAASSLDHLNICSIYEFGEHEGQPFIAMQLLQGETLRDSLTSGALRDSASGGQVSLERLLDLAIQIANGLQAAHEQGIVHRDIKPANIFITTKGVAKILDFGLAKLALLPSVEQAIPAELGGKDATHRLPPRAAGTAAYMSPEQVRRQPLDARTDLFSFGVVLYEMATGKRAFTGDSASALQDGILSRTPTPPGELNPKLPAQLQSVIQKCLEKDRNLRYQKAAEIRSDLERIKREPERRGPRHRWTLLATAVAVVAALIVGSLYWRSRRTATLTAKDTIIVADFVNTTGDSVFDDALKQGLAVQLEQSPFLELVSDSKVNETLKRMGRSPGDRLTPEVTREICQRTGSKAMLTGSIASLGRQYVIGLTAVDCDRGDLLGDAQEQASSKETVPKALGNAAISLRTKLGESLSSVQKYATPLEEATTPSLDALKAYSLGRRTKFTKGDAAALPFFKRAVELDPGFALAYQAMSIVYDNLNEAQRSAENARKAYELREKVSERERFAIEASYYSDFTGELEKAAQVCEMWQQAYPRDATPYNRLGSDIFIPLGNWDRALAEAREALRLEPNSQGNYINLGVDYASLNRLDEAEEVYQQAEKRKFEGKYLQANRYQLAFLKGNATQMTQLAAAAVGNPEGEDWFLAAQADTEAWYGKLRNARELTGRAIESAQHNDAKEVAAAYQAAAALREVEAGNPQQARADAEAALKLAPNRDVRAMAALALARAGDTSTAERLATELDKTFPLNTVVQRSWLPTIRAAVALQRKDPKRAVELLQVASGIELGQPTNITVFLCPVYLRGDAYLMLRDGNKAAAEFQKFIDHRGVAVNFPWGALARLGLARAHAMQGNTDKARTAYEDFLALWKDADPDVPVLKQAKTEYGKLQ